MRGRIKTANGFVHIFLLLAIAAGFIILGYFSYKNGQIKFPAGMPQNSVIPSPSTALNTADWKTYYSKIHNYSFSYPGDYKIFRYGDANASRGKPVPADEYELWIYLAKDDRIPQSDFLLKAGFLNFSYPNPNLTREDVAFGSRKFEKYTTVDNKSVWYIPINPKLKKQEIFIEIAKDKIDAETVNRILSSFKLLLSNKEALEKVKNIPQVKKFLENTPNSRTDIEDSEDRKSWVIHVYELKDTHTATFGWYEVDKETEVVKDTLFSNVIITEGNKCKEGEVLKDCKLGPCCCPTGAVCD